MLPSTPQKPFSPSSITNVFPPLELVEEELLEDELLEEELEEELLEELEEELLEELDELLDEELLELEEELELVVTTQLLTNCHELSLPGTVLVYHLA